FRSLRHVRLLGRRVDLVGGEDDRQVGAAQHLHHFPVLFHGGGGGVDHQDHHVGRRQRRLHLLADGLFDGVLGVHFPPAGVDQDEAASRPVGVELAAVAGYPRLLLDDGESLADYPVDERRLADVGPSDDGDDRQAAGGHGGFHHQNARPSGGDRSQRFR